MSEAGSEVGDGPVWAVEPRPSREGQPAPLLIRLVARFIDQFVYGVPLAVVLVPLLFFGPEDVDWFFLVIPLGAFAYFTLMEGRSGSTVGKRACGLRVLGTDGSVPSLSAAAVRNAWLLIGLVPWVGVPLYFAALLAVVVTIHISDGNRGVHDGMAGTTVVSDDTGVSPRRARGASEPPKQRIR
jgi:uncharacterized RDD family membrane protein YckC